MSHDTPDNAAKLDPEALDSETDTSRSPRDVGNDVPVAPPLFAKAPGIGVRVGALHVSALTPLGWALTVAGIVGTLLIAVSYRAGWLSASLEHFGSSVTESLTLEESTSIPLSWMYRIATLGLIGCAMALVFVPAQVRHLFRLAGYAAAGLSLLSAAIATFVIATVLAESPAYFGDPETVEYGWGLYAGYLGILAVTGFIGGFSYLTRAPIES
ncbi:MAG: hypothetical protein ACRDTU_03395 [Micromonosporaceae bacterium]